MKRLFCLSASCIFAGLLMLSSAVSQEPAKKDETAVSKGSIVEDRAAKKLLEAGDARYEADEVSKAVEIWQSVIERYPRSKIRYEAYMKLGNFYLQRDRQYDKARAQFEQVSVEENRNEEQRAEATLKAGICFYEARNFGKCFQVMRDVIEKFPVSRQVTRPTTTSGWDTFNSVTTVERFKLLRKSGQHFPAKKERSKSSRLASVYS